MYNLEGRSTSSLQNVYWIRCGSFLLRFIISFVGESHFRMYISLFFLARVRSTVVMVNQTQSFNNCDAVNYSYSRIFSVAIRDIYWAFSHWCVQLPFSRVFRSTDLEDKSADRSDFLLWDTMRLISGSIYHFFVNEWHSRMYISLSFFGTGTFFRSNALPPLEVPSWKMFEIRHTWTDACFTFPTVVVSCAMLHAREYCVLTCVPL